MGMPRGASGLVIGVALSVVCVVWSGVTARDAFAQQGGTTGNVNLFLGGKALDEDDWEPVDSQGEIGIEVDFRPRSWPINLVVGLRGAADEADVFDPVFGFVTLESWTSELSFGVKKIWEPQGVPIRPYIGGGLLYATAEITVKDSFGSASEDDSGVGFWLGGGVFFTLAEHFNIGLDLRVSRAEVEIAGFDVEAGGDHFGLILGYHW